MQSGGGLVTGAVVSSGGVDIDPTVGPAGNLGQGSGVITGQTVRDGVTLMVGAILDSRNPVVVSGGILTVPQGAYVSGLTVLAGGLLTGKGEIEGDILVAGVVSGVVVSKESSPSDLEIQSGGSAVSVTVLGNDDMQVDAGGIATGTIMSASSDSYQLSDYGVTIGTVLYSFATEEVEARGIASGTSINSGGLEIVDFGGIASATSIGSSGTETVFGATNNANLNGGHQIVSSGGVAFESWVSSAGLLTVVSGGAALDAMITGGQALISGGLASGGTVFSGGLVTVLAGGETDSLIIAGGAEVVSNGGVAVGVTVSSGGVETVSSGGVASDIIVHSGGALNLAIGGSANGNIISSGGAFGFAAVVSSGQTLTVPAAAATNAFTLDGATILVGGKEILISSTVNSGGTLNLAAGAMASGLIVSSGGTVNGPGEVLMGAVVYGSASGVTVGDASAVGGMQVASGGSASGLVVKNGSVRTRGVTVGTILASSTVNTNESDVFGSAVSTTIGYGAEQVVESGGFASGAIVQAGGTEFVSSGGRTSGAQVASGGSEMLISGAVATNVSVASGGALFIDPYIISGGTYSAHAVTATTVISGATIASGGFEDVIYTDVQAATLTLGAGAAGAAIVIEAGARLVGPGTLELTNYAGGTVSGVVIGTAVDNGGLIMVSGGVASNVTVSNGGLAIQWGASATGTVVDSPIPPTPLDVVGVLSTGTLSGGQNGVEDFGVASGTSLLSGAAQVIEAGGVASATIVNSGGVEIVTSGGETVSATVKSGGVEVFSSAGAAVGVTVSSGGMVEFQADVLGGQTFSAGVATATRTISGVTVVKGGVVDVIEATVLGGLILGSGAVGTDDVVASGGVETVLSGGLADGSLVMSGGTEVLSLGGGVSALTLNVGATLDLAGVAATSASVNAQNALVLTSGGNAVDTISLAGPTAGLAYSVRSDGSGGTDVVVSIPAPIAGAAPTVTAVNGATVAINDGPLAGLVTAPSGLSLSVIGAALAAGSAGAGTVSLDAATNVVDFTPAAGFAGTAVISVTVTDAIGLTVIQPVDVNVVVQASAPVVTPPNATTTTVNGNVTTIQTFSPTGTLISTETITVNGTTTQTQYFNATGTQTSATIQQVNGAFTQVQNFDGNWNQLNASITNTEGGGNSVVQNFDGSWNQTGAVVTTVNGSKTQVQTFNASWVQLSATITTVNGAVTQTQNFDGNWNQTSANLTTTLASGAVQSQNFNASWQQTSASITSHPSANQTQVQNFNASWQQTSATITTVAGGQTTTQSFNGSWTFQGATIDTPYPFGALTDRLDTYDAAWNPLSEVDTAYNGGQSYFIWGQAGGAQTFIADSAHSTTYIFTPGSVAGDAIAGLHTLNLGGAIHDVIDFEGYGAGAHLVQVDATHWQVVATGDASETFSLTGGETLGAGDYAFVATGSQLTLSDSPVGGAGAGGLTDSSGSGSITIATTGTFSISGGNTGSGIVATPVGGASIGAAAAAPSAAVFNQFSASGFSTPPAAGVSALVVAPRTHTAALIAPPEQT